MDMEMDVEVDVDAELELEENIEAEVEVELIVCVFRWLIFVYGGCVCCLSGAAMLSRIHDGQLVKDSITSSTTTP